MNINNPTTFAAPALVYSTSNSSGTSGALRADDTLAIFSTTTPVAISTSTVSSATGDNAFGSREDHVHGSTAIIAAASEAEMVANSSNTVYGTPGRTQYHPGVAKMWASIDFDDSPGQIDESYNTDGFSDTGTGTGSVTIDVDFDTVDWGPTASVIQGAAYIAHVDTRAVGSIDVVIFSVGGVASNTKMAIAGYGTQ